MQGFGQRVAISVPEAAARLGLGRNQGYEAARRGEIPTIRIGKRILVPLAALERMLSGEAPAAAQPRLVATTKLSGA